MLTPQVTKCCIKVNILNLQENNGSLRICIEVNFSDLLETSWFLKGDPKEPALPMSTPAPQD